MKRILTFLLVAGISTSSFAQYRTAGNSEQNSNSNYEKNRQYDNGQNSNYQNSALVVNASSQNGFTVSVDNGNPINSNSNTVRLRTLSAGNHTVTVSEYRSSILGRQVPRNIYNSTINFKAGVETTLNIDNNGQVTITEKQFSGNGNNGNNGKGKKYKKNKYPHDNRNGEKERKHGHDDDHGGRKDD
jgi:hypothetical protein